MPSLSIDELAIFGGEPRFAAPLHVGRPNLGDPDRMQELVAGILERRWLTNDGELVRAFEDRVASLTGAAHAVAVCNATVGLQLAARALGLQGKVIVPSFTFVGTAHALSWIGLEPVFCDVDSVTHTLAPQSVQAAIGPGVSAILGVHLWGRPCQVDALDAIAARAGIPLIFDAAHALGCTHAGAAMGGLGAASVFSFHATKVANSAEGGAVTTDDGELAARLRLMRNFGFSDFDFVSGLGTNAKMSELSAAMGLTSLDALDASVEANRRNHRAYARGLDGVASLTLHRYDDAERHNHHYVVLELDPDAGAPARDDLVAVLEAENVLARRYFHPGCHRLEPYRGTTGTLPVTEAVSDRVVVLPTGPTVSEDDVATICAVIRAAVEHGGELRRRLASAG